MTAPWEEPRVKRGMTAQFARLKDKQAAGEKIIGWKVGFGSPSAMALLKIDAPLVGYLTDKAHLRPGAAVSIAGWTKPVAEPEVAVHMARDLARGASRETAAAAIAGLGPAMEIADLDHKPEDAERILAGNIFQKNVMLGPCDASRAGARWDGLEARISHGGKLVASTTDIPANTGDLVDLVRLVADTLPAFGESLKAGQVIIPGSVVPPIFVQTGDTVSFELAPIGQVAVTFTA